MWFNQSKILFFGGKNFSTLLIGRDLKHFIMDLMGWGYQEERLIKIANGKIRKGRG